MPLENAIAGYYTSSIPEHVLRYLIDDRGISWDMIVRYRIGWHRTRIMIPIFGRLGHLMFFKTARGPGNAPDEPKMLCWPTGNPPELYGWENLTQLQPDFVVICEGEFDRLVLESRGIAAVTGTAGAGVFLPEWVGALAGVRHLFVCYDRDDAGENGAMMVARQLPQARIVQLPDDVGPGGDLTDFFVRLGRSVLDFHGLLHRATSVPASEAAPPTLPSEAEPVIRRTDSLPRDPRVLRIKAGSSLETVVKTYVGPLRHSGRTLIGRCPFHPDQHPSFVLYPEHQRYRCYGCGQHGDVIQFVMDAERLTFPEALRALEHRLPQANPTHGDSQTDNQAGS